MKKAKPRVVVAMSGGVDSSVAATLLKKRGYEVIGVFIRVWEPPREFVGHGRGCDWREERRWARRAAATLEIPLITFDLSRDYKRAVVNHMLREYRAGRTPNPDVLCNKEIKFGALWKKARNELGADYIATGHYARIDGGLRRGKDQSKDQSYFLWAIEPKLLPRILFPIGGWQKTSVRTLAKKMGLLNAARPDSQGLCFIGQIDFKDFLKRFIKQRPGQVLNDAGEVIGEHPGAALFTFGERHGFRLHRHSTNEPRHYVVAKDLKRNTITVAPQKIIKTKVATSSERMILLLSVNWLGAEPVENRKYLAQVRYHGEKYACRLRRNGKNWRVWFDRAPDFATPGQSLVIYDRDRCLGGGIIASAA